MPWGVAAAAVGAAGSLGAAAMQSSTAGKAGAQAQRNLEMTLPFMQSQFNQTSQAYQPYVESGGRALDATTSLMGLNGPDAADAAMSGYRTSPGYQWQLGQGLRAVDAGAAAAGLTRSGATLKAEQTYGQGLADQDFSLYYNRLFDLTKMGNTAVGQEAAAGQTLVGNITGNVAQQNAALTGAANAQNSITGNTAQGLTNTVNKLLADPSAQSAIKGLFAPSTPAITGADYTTAPGFDVGNASVDPNSYWA